MKHTKKHGIIPNIPSFLELYILDFIDYCSVCNVHEKHPIKLCIDCEKHICFSYDDNIWFLNNTSDVICIDCRIKRLKNQSPIMFVRMFQ